MYYKVLPTLDHGQKKEVSKESTGLNSVTGKVKKGFEEKGEARKRSLSNLIIVILEEWNEKN